MSGRGRGRAKAALKKKKEASDSSSEEASPALETSARSQPQRRNSKAGKEEKEEAANKSAFGLVWTHAAPTLLVLDSSELKGSTKIAAFDMDSTLIVPKSGAKFPSNRNDWKWWDPVVPTKLKELSDKGFKIVIFSNQGGIEKGRQNEGDITGKILDMSKESNLPLQAFIAGAEDNYRKPHVAMWDYMVEHCNGGVTPDLEASFYCGDAAGRPAGWKAGKKKDFSVGDRQFCNNVGTVFKTPEELFLEENPAPFDWGSLNPNSIIESTKGKVLDTTDWVSSSQEMIIMVGRPASGKSTIVTKFLEPKGYIRVNMDTLKTDAKCIKTATESLAEGASVVIDNTNGPTAKRAKYIQIATKAGVPVRCFYLTTDQKVANHLNYVRVRETKGEVRRIPDVAYRTFNKNFEEPSTSEGFTEVKKIEFVADLRDDPIFTKMFLGWTPEGI